MTAIEETTLRLERDELKTRLRRIELFLTNNVAEVKNHIGGVVGYTLNLDADKTEQLFRFSEGKQT